ncbi:MAG: histidine phosphatase family protein [Lachnospiraceae bacterium]|nr:histidine phosphatase family protein [Lachnospiraceae bacterium]
MFIYIVRHGETEANVHGYLQGWLDKPLNEKGRSLAVMTGQGMKGIRFDSCISSPLIRARETAEIILRESGNGDVPVMTDDRIKEINFGSSERTDVKDASISWFFANPSITYRFESGESILQVMERTQSLLKELIERDDDKTYLISTHGCALRAMLNFLYDDPSDYWHGHVPYNCCVNIIEAKEQRVGLIADDRIYYDESMIVDRYKRKPS